MEQGNEYNREIWEKSTIIKDMVHGYIKVAKPIMIEIVDSEQFQRLKDIEQTGMEALYPSATHKRFTHSLGVFHLAKRAFEEFQSNVRSSYLTIYRAIKNKAVPDYNAVWQRWGLLFQLAALLHDCGHSPFSHTLEFIYDLPEVKEGDKNVKELNHKLLEGMDGRFAEDFTSHENGSCGKAHERMSALYVKTKQYDGLRSRVEKLLKSYVQAYQLGDVYKKGSIMDDDIEFMIRMIIGCFYNYEKKEYYKQKGWYDSEECKNWYIELQLRNCIIGMLNSQLDVDNLDYVVRDSKFSGYANHTVDLERLLSSFTIVRAFQVSDLKMSKVKSFDYCINLKAFEGEKVAGRLTGACHILCETKNIEACGRIALKNQPEESEARQRFYQTTDDFSANLSFDGNEGDRIRITPLRVNEKAFAYIHFKGEMKGELSGVVFANDYEAQQGAFDWEEAGELRIYFAYEQKCMSVLMSAVYNSNFEKKWIYSHHISTFTNHYIYIYLLEKYAAYVLERKKEELKADIQRLLESLQYQERTAEEISDENAREMKQLKDNQTPRKGDGKIYKQIAKINSNILVLENNVIRKLMQLSNALDKEAAYYNKKLYDVLQQCCACAGEKKYLSAHAIASMEEVYNKYKTIQMTIMQEFSNILAMYDVHYVDGVPFYKTSDRDLLAAYKNLYMRITKGKELKGKIYNEFAACYEELIQRRYLKCLWKSQPEFAYYFSDWTKDEIAGLRKALDSSMLPSSYQYLILSDNIDKTILTKFQKEFWVYLKKNYKVQRFVYVPQQIRTKKFVDYEMYMKRGKKVLRAKDIKLFNDDRQDLDFFYFYYKQSEPVEMDVFNILNWLKKKIKETK